MVNLSGLLWEYPIRITSYFFRKLQVDFVFPLLNRNNNNYFQIQKEAESSKMLSVTM